MLPAWSQNHNVMGAALRSPPRARGFNSRAGPDLQLGRKRGARWNLAAPACQGHDEAGAARFQRASRPFSRNGMVPGAPRTRTAAHQNIKSSGRAGRAADPELARTWRRRALGLATWAPTRTCGPRCAAGAGARYAAHTAGAGGGARRVGGGGGARQSAGAGFKSRAEATRLFFLQ